MSYYGPPINFNSPSYPIRILTNVYNTDFGILDFQSNDEAVQWEKEYNDTETVEDFVIIYVELISHVIN